MAQADGTRQSARQAQQTARPQDEEGTGAQLRTVSSIVLGSKVTTKLIVGRAANNLAILICFGFMFGGFLTFFLPLIGYDNLRAFILAWTIPAMVTLIAAIYGVYIKWKYAKDVGTGRHQQVSWIAVLLAAIATGFSIALLVNSGWMYDRMAFGLFILVMLPATITMLGFAMTWVTTPMYEYMQYIFSIVPMMAAIIPVVFVASIEPGNIPGEINGVIEPIFFLSAASYLICGSLLHIEASAEPIPYREVLTASNERLRDFQIELGNREKGLKKKAQLLDNDEIELNGIRKELNDLKQELNSRENWINGAEIQVKKNISALKREEKDSMKTVEDIEAKIRKLQNRIEELQNEIRKREVQILELENYEKEKTRTLSGSALLEAESELSEKEFSKETKKKIEKLQELEEKRAKEEAELFEREREYQERLKEIEEREKNIREGGKAPEEDDLGSQTPDSQQNMQDNLHNLIRARKELDKERHELEVDMISLEIVIDDAIGDLKHLPEDHSLHPLRKKFDSLSGKIKTLKSKK